MIHIYIYGSYLWDLYKLPELPRLPATQPVLDDDNDGGDDHDVANTKAE